MRKAFLCILASAALSGCATVVFSDEGGRQMVDIVNTGWYFLNFVPMASGNPDAPNECSCRILRQTTTLENNVKLLDRAIAEKGARVYTDFAAALWKELGQDELNEAFLDDAATLGTGILHYYWDADALSGSLAGRGALRGSDMERA